MARFLKKLVLTVQGEIAFAVLLLFTYLILGMFIANQFGVIYGSALLDFLVIAFCIWWLSPRFENMDITVEKDFTKVSKKQVIMLLSCLVILFLIIAFVGQVFGSFIMSQTNDPSFKNYKSTANSNALLYFLFGILLAPVAEELMFRGVLFNTFKFKMSVILSAILQAFLFSIIHGTLVHLPGTFLLGLFTCLIYNLTAKFRYNIFVHMTYNLIAFFAGHFKVFNWMLNWWFLSSISLVAVIVLVYLLVLTNKLPAIKIAKLQQKY